MVEDGKKNLVHTIFYGCLDCILECQLDGNDPIWSKFNETFLLLAVITLYSTRGQNAVQCYTTYSGTTAQIVADLRVVQCVVGRVKSRGSWGIIDRSRHLTRTEFISTEDQNEDDNEDEYY